MIDGGGEQFVLKFADEGFAFSRKLIPLDPKRDQMRNDLSFPGNVASFGVEQLFDALDQFAGRKAARRSPAAPRKTVHRIADLC